MSIDPKVVAFDRSSAYVHHRAMVNRRENHPVDALELMRHAVEQSPENREYRLDLAELYCEMGCHEQSNRLLLDMLAQKDAPAECYYGLALNQLGMNDVEGAQHSLRMYRRAEPSGAHVAESVRLSAELEIYDEMNRPVSRKLHRAMSVGDRACAAMREGDNERALRLFERCLLLNSEQYEMRALYAMALLLSGDEERALQEAVASAEGFPPSARAMSVAALVLFGLEEEEKAERLIRKVIEERPIGAERRLLLYSLTEMGMHAEASECARLALQETPYDRKLLHVRAVGLSLSGAPEGRAERFWQRILRIDPEDCVASYYLKLCAEGKVSDCELTYAYQVPDDEYERRFAELSAKVDGGVTAVRGYWKNEPEFRQLIRWASETDDERLRRVAVTVYAAIDDPEAGSMLRSLLFGRELSPELKLHATTMLRLRGVDLKQVLPAGASEEGLVASDSETMLEDFLVGERQLLRYASEMLEDAYDVSALPALAMIWAVYRRHRGLRYDPLVSSEAASAALCYVYFLQRGERANVGELAKLFGCSERRLVFYAGLIAGVLDKLEGETKDEDL